MNILQISKSILKYVLSRRKFSTDSHWLGFQQGKSINSLKSVIESVCVFSISYGYKNA